MSTKKLDTISQGAKHELMPGKPFRSKLTPHFEQIKEMRLKRFTWKEISDELVKFKVVAKPHVIFEFFKRHSKRPVPLGYPTSDLLEESPKAQRSPSFQGVNLPSSEDPLKAALEGDLQKQSSKTKQENDKWEQLKQASKKMESK